MAFDKNLMLRNTTTTLSTSETSDAGVNFGAADQRNLTYVVQVPLAPTGTSPTLDVKIQESTDGTTWVDLVVFSQITAKGRYYRTVRGRLPYRRQYSTVGGSGTINFGAVVVGVDVSGRYTSF